MKRINSLKIWIIAEIAAIAVIGILIIIKTAFAGNVTEDAGYTLPSDSSKEVSFNDIELPEDLTAEGNEDGVPEKDADKYKLEEYPEEVKARLAEMNTEQKLSMLFITTPEALCETDGIISADEGFRRAYDSYPVTGLIFSDSNFESEADGMKLLKSLREWSRDDTGMNLLLGYKEQGDKDPEELSDRGFSLYLMEPGDRAQEKAAEALEYSMMPAIVMSFEEAVQTDNGEIAMIAGINDTNAVIDAINDGKSLLYSTEQAGIVQGLKEAYGEGRITDEAIDHAAAYAVTMRLALTEIRSEDMEKEPEEETEEEPQEEQKEAEKPDEEKKKADKAADKPQKTAEQLAAEEAQKQAAELAKQIEEAQKAAAAAQAENAANQETPAEQQPQQSEQQPQQSEQPQQQEGQ